MPKQINPTRTHDKACALYGFLVLYFIEHGEWPGLAEMMPALHTVSMSSVHHYLTVLAGWGWIERYPRLRYAMKLTRPTERGLTREQLAARWT